MTLVATSSTVVSDVVAYESLLEHGYARKMATLLIASGAKIGQVYKSDGDGTYSILAAADVGFRLTPVVANSAAYQLSIVVGSLTRVFTITSDSDATAAEIAIALAAAIEADTTLDNFVSAANESGVLEIVATGTIGIDVIPLTANLNMSNALGDLAILVDDNVYTTTTTGDRSLAVLVGGPAASAPIIIKKEGLVFGDTLSDAQKNAVYRALESQGMKMGTRIR